MRVTRSLCNTCYKEVQAVVCSDGGQAIIAKSCPDHGMTVGLLESDSSFFQHCEQNPDQIYAGHLVDVTTRCNINCKYCFYERGQSDIPVETILENCRQAPGPYILTGGEPTLHPEIFAIIDRVQQIGPAYMLTNGYGLEDSGLGFREYLNRLTDHTGVVQIGLSYHKEARWFPAVIANIVSHRVKFDTIFFVIDSLEELPAVVTLAEDYHELFSVVRIKIASKVWNERNNADIFVSDVIKWFGNHPGELVLAPSGKISYYRLTFNGVRYAIIKWYNIDNIDLNDVDMPPTYTTKDGRIMDFVKAMIVNESI